jgi:hypothetical protein
MVRAAPTLLNVLRGKELRRSENVTSARLVERDEFLVVVN